MGPFYPLPTTAKYSSKTQPRRLRPSHVHLPATNPFQRQLDFYSTYPPSGTFQPYQDERHSFKGPLSSSTIATNNPSATSSPVHGIPSISPPTSSHNTNLMPFLADPTSPSSILWGPSLAGTSPLSPTYENRATSMQSDVLSHSIKDTTVRLCDSVPLRDGDPKGWRSSEFEDRVVQVINRVTGERVTREMLPDTLPRCSQEHHHHPHCRNLYQHQAALHSHPPTPFLPKQRCSSLPPTFHHLNGFNGQTRRFAPPPVNSPTTPPFQQRWPNFYSTYPSPNMLQLYRDDQGIPKEPPPPIVVDNISNTSSSIHDVPSMSPTLSRDFYSSSPSLRPHLSTSSPLKRRSSSLPPTLRRLENCCGGQLLRSQPSIPIVSNRCHPFSSTYQSTPSRTPASACSPAISRQRQHNTRNERSRTPPSRAASTIERKGFMSSLTPHTPYPPPWTNQPSPGKRDEQGPKVPTLPGIPTADSDGSPSSTTSSTSSNDLRFASPPYSGGRTCYRSSTARHPCNSTPAYANDARHLGDSKDSAKVVGTEGQLTEEMEMVMEEEEVTEDDATRERIMMPARTSSASIALCPASTTPRNSNPILSSTTPTSSSPPYHLAPPFPTDSSLVSCRWQPGANAELNRECMEGEQTLQHNLLEHELELTLPTTLPFQQRSLNFYETYLPLDIPQSYQNRRSSSKESASPTTFDNPFQYPVSLHSRSPTSQKRRCISLSPQKRISWATIVEVTVKH